MDLNSMIISGIIAIKLRIMNISVITKTIRLIHLNRVDRQIQNKFLTIFNKIPYLIYIMIYGI